jgi:hypothetical protein
MEKIEKIKMGGFKLPGGKLLIHHSFLTILCLTTVGAVSPEGERFAEYQSGAQ